MKTYKGTALDPESDNATWVLAAIGLSYMLALTLVLWIEWSAVR